MLLLLHLQFLHVVALHVVEQQQDFEIISTVVISSSGCHFRRNRFSFSVPTLMGLVMLHSSHLLSITSHSVNKLAGCVLLNIFTKRVLIANLSLEEH